MACRPPVGPRSAFPAIVATSLVLASFGLVGCSDSPPFEGGPACGVSIVTHTVSISLPRMVDLLLVVDDSASMAGQQTTLRAAVLHALQAVEWSEDDALSLHLGVVRSDLGVGEVASLSGGCTSWGADGRMQRAQFGDDPACDGFADAQPFLSSERGDNLALILERLACRANTGADGCGFEQPLEAALKALTPSTSDLRFRRERNGAIESDSPGQGDRGNAGFLRPASELVIVFLTDEDDCSAADYDLYADGDTDYPTVLTEPVPDPNAHCVAHANAQKPVERYVDGFLALRPNSPELLTVVVVAGISPDLLEANSFEESTNGVVSLRTDHAALLAESGMSAQPSDDPAFLLPACTRPDPADPLNAAAGFPAYPARRLVQVVQGLEERGANVQLGSICSPVDADAADYTLNLRSVTAALSPGIAADEGGPGFELPRPMLRDSSDRVACRVTETLQAGERCDGYAGRTVLRVTDASEVCEVAQVRVPTELRVPGADVSGDGWYYDDFNPTEWPRQGPGIRYTGSVFYAPGSTVRVECVSAATTSSGDGGVRDTCVPSAD